MLTKTKWLITFTALLVLTACVNNKANDQATTNNEMNMYNNGSDMYLFAGTYTSESKSKGIYIYKIDTKSGEVDSISMVNADNPSYLVLSKNEKYLYAVGENGENSSVSSFELDKRLGKLSLINKQPSKGADPCYIEIDDTGLNILTANYSGGSISLLPIRDDGGLSSTISIFEFEGSGPDVSRQTRSHLHSVRFTPDNRYLFATDLGSDKIYRYNATGSVFKGQPSINKSNMIEISTPPGMGPRHFDFHPSGKYMYLLGELSGEVVVYDYNDGSISEKQRVVSDSLGARGAADIHVSPNGKYLYASNRLEGDGISIFSINDDNGKLTKVGYQLTGKHPRNFAITPNGELLLVACRDDNKVQIFSIDKESGTLTNTGNDIKIDKPVCLKFASI